MTVNTVVLGESFIYYYLYIGKVLYKKAPNLMVSSMKNWFIISHIRDNRPSSPRAAKDLFSYPKFLPTSTPRHIPQDHDKAREQITVYTPLHDPVLSRIHNARTSNPRCICSGPLCAVRIDHSSNTFRAHSSS